MSFVGPRPERPFFVEQFRREVPGYDYRHQIKAGVTGLAQVEGKYSTSAWIKLKNHSVHFFEMKHDTT